jgi:transketolase
MKATREAFGEALLDLGIENKKVVALSADLQDSTKAIYFQEKFKDRFFNVGISEQDMIGIATGLALEGFIPFVSSFACFLTTRPYDMIRILAGYNNANIKFVATHSGLTVGEDGATAQALEDIAVMRVLPNIKVFSPVDAIETKKIVKAVAEIDGPVYIRLARAKYPELSREEDEFSIGKGTVMRDGEDISIIAIGLMVSESLKAADLLEMDGYSARVINMSTIKPIDKELIVQTADKTGLIITVEEHQVNGGLGSAVSEIVSQENPVKMKIMGVEDSFGESGTPEELLKKYRLNADSIYLEAKKLIQSKK